jgi:methyl-accepting chemotaxis protein
MNSNPTKNAESSDKALQLMTEMDEQISRANVDLKTMQAVVFDMVGSSKKISKVIKLIDGIAFQTNILSLNAAVEAASAGESGAGFSVVAKKVGSLAQKSALAATDTAALIDLTLQSTHTGESAVLALGVAMCRVTDTATLVRTQISLLQNSCRDQNRAVAMIKQSLLQLGRTAQETAAVAEQSAAAGSCLTEQATILRQIVALLQT